MLEFDIEGATKCNVLAPLVFFGCITYSVLAFVDVFIEKSLVEKFEKILISKKILPLYAFCVLWAVANY